MLTVRFPDPTPKAEEKEEIDSRKGYKEKREM